MKKLLFTIIGLGGMLTMSATDTLPQLERAIGGNQIVKQGDITRIVGGRNQKPVLTRTGENTYEFGYCAGMAQALGFGVQYAGYVQEEAIEIPTDISRDWVGMKITKVLIGFGYSTNKDINVYITDDLNGVPQVFQAATIEHNAVSFDASGQGTLTEVWNEVVLDTPYEIDGNPFYVGFQTLLTSGTCYPIVTDYLVSYWGLGDIIGLSTGSNAEEMAFENIGLDFGNLCIKIELEGEMPTQHDGISGEMLFPDELTNPGKEFSADFVYLNLGSEPITDMDVDCFIDGEELSDVKVEFFNLNSNNDSSDDQEEDPEPAEDENNATLDFGKLGFVRVSAKANDTEGINLPLTVVINNLVYGEEKVKSGEKLTSQISVVSKMYPKKMVVEEFTGTWCGWCPRGIVGMEYMREKYGDQGFIGIAAHSNDAMQASSYNEMIGRYSQNSFPSAVCNRNNYFDPSVQTLEDLYENLKDNEIYVKVDAAASYDATTNSITANATAQFTAEQVDATYAFAFVVVQNNVGPYAQTNYFSGSKTDILEGWNERGSKVSTEFEMVARYIEDGFGIKGSMPTYIEPGKDYSYSVNMPLETIISNINDNVVDINIDNCYVVAMLLNTYTGEVMNAAQVNIDNNAGVENLIADPANGIYRVYNPQGIKVLETKDSTLLNTLPKGIYIINGKKVAL